MKVVGFFFSLSFQSVLHCSPRRVPRRLVAFPKCLASIRASGAVAASLRCRWALCGVAVMMQVDQFEVGE